MNRSDISRLAALSTLLVILTSAVVGAMLLLGMSATLREGQLKQAQGDLTAALEAFSSRVATLRRQTLALAGTPPVRGIPAAQAHGGIDPRDGSTEAQWKSRLAEIFAAYLKANDDVLQVRYVGVADGGRELLRMERDKVTGALFRADDSTLQRKRDRYYYRQAISYPTSRTYVSDIDLNVENGVVQTPYAPTLRVASPIDDEDGKRVGLVVINVDAERLMNRIGEHAPEGARLHLTNERGHYLMRPDMNHVMSLLPATERNAAVDWPELAPLFRPDLNPGRDAAGPGRIGRVTSLIRKDDVVHAATVVLNPEAPQRRLVAVVVTPKAEVFHEIWRYRPQVLAMAGGFGLILLGAGAAFFLSRTLSRSMGLLAAAADQLSEGASSETIDWPNPRIEEVARLNRALRHLADAVHDREARLTEREAKLRAIMDSTPGGIISIDAEGRIESANAAALEMFGYDEAELIGRNVSLLMPAPDRDAHAGYLARYFRTGERRMIGIPREELALRRNGEVFPIELAVSEQVRDGRHAFTGMVADLSDQKRVDRMQRDFVSTVSHELRTPLTAIKGALDLIGSGALGAGPPVWADMLALARKNSERLVRLVNDILDLDRISSGRMQYAFTLETLGDLVESAVAENRPMAEARGVSVTLATRPAPTALVRADRDRILQVLANLLSNAVKVTPAGETIRVDAAAIDGGWRISVTDAGTGVPAAFHDRIFGKFSQSDSSDSARRGGSGLGLHISKAIVEAHQGRIGFDSPPGRGASFWFELADSGLVWPQDEAPDDAGAPGRDPLRDRAEDPAPEASPPASPAPGPGAIEGSAPPPRAAIGR